MLDKKAEIVEFARRGKRAEPSRRVPAGTERLCVRKPERLRENVVDAASCRVETGVKAHDGDLFF